MKRSPHKAELERPHAARIGTDGQDLPRRRGPRHPRADRSRGAIRLGEGEDRGHPSRPASSGTAESEREALALMAYPQPACIF